MSVDLVKFLESWAIGWANDGRGGAPNIDWDRTNKLFAPYYQLYGVDANWEMSNLQITQNSPGELSVYSAEYGPFSHEQDINFAHTYVATDTFEWSITESISAGTSASVSAGVPGVFSAEVGITFDLSLSSTQGQSKEESTTWDTSLHFVLPPGEVATLEMITVKLEASGTMQLVGTLSGSVAIGLSNQWQGHYFYFVPVAELATNYNKRPDVRVDGDKVVVAVPVKFDGIAVTSTYVKQKTVAKDGTVKTQERARSGMPSLMRGAK
jgi:hypothetical protein